ncbi:hypothetical protein MJO28_014847 [Puccinia striiformis f. sp. tritici]|uniref:VWFA domain-containing protein n=2 Tax=Puccinia striiformis f. sp. tritici TaxID=168172 RepID=A0A0L0UW10_9BASI|nr:uncharacterized protein Pst134EA_032699 [Puccinia striiformis f. sp. tritici]XP_047798606.1 hypothetical protein Pst134EA_027727 [Puccinia striiformis f. sp. tritici]KAI9625213.1 hypothetical protein H4Q26_016404 [Puccinia striiformis f. sp. tritici PST-130]KNE90919.1 hypothetical protein PSTG_15665 [Puccinia striiformis f. sp. tritici PST-78]KAH9442019.1 hypothetical protein Pst134EB_028293 [Puccinia striiformis f. sp. tritici]KAH9443457.1 hypothetical protein Pst134EA_032699 [Puccinia str
MPLEATICMLDNSEYSINSDIIPTRLEAAADAVKTIFKAKTNSNPESTCGLMTFAGKSPTVLVTPTTDEGKIHVSLQSIKPSGTPDLIAGLSVAGLALKHRQEKNQRQRAIVLLSSPLPSDLTKDELARIGKKLKKNNVAVDVVLFGSEVATNEERMRAFVDAVESGGNSTMIVIPGGLPGLLSDHIKQSDILAEEGFGAAGGSGAGANGDGAGMADGGGLDMDPNLDPELAMALRMSLQEEEARQAAATRQQAGSTSSDPSQPTTESTTDAPKPEEMGDVKMVPEPMDDELTKALAMSRGEDVEMNDAEGGAAKAEGGGDMDEDEDLTEEEAIAKAIEMSMKENQQKK